MTAEAIEDALQVAIVNGNKEETSLAPSRTTLSRPPRKYLKRTGGLGTEVKSPGEKSRYVGPTVARFRHDKLDLFLASGGEGGPAELVPSSTGSREKALRPRGEVNNGKGKMDWNAAENSLAMARKGPVILEEESVPNMCNMLSSVWIILGRRVL